MRDYGNVRAARRLAMLNLAVSKLDKFRELADKLEKESPKPGPGGWESKQ